MRVPTSAPVFGYIMQNNRGFIILSCLNASIIPVPNETYILPAMVVNSLDRLVPSVVTAVTMASATKDAIRPYSRAVTPRRSARRLMIFVEIALRMVIA